MVFFIFAGNFLAFPFASRLKFQLLFYNVFCFFVFVSCFSYLFEFVALDIEAAFFLLTVNFTLFFILSVVDLCLTFKRKLITKRGLSTFDYLISLFLISAVVIEIYSKLHEYSIIHIFSNVLRDDFINAYLLYFLIFFTAYLFYNGESKLDMFLSIFCLFLCFLLGVKGIVLLILFVYIIRQLDSKFDTKSIMKLIIICSVGIVSFYSSYVVPRVLFEGEHLLDVIYDINQRFIFYSASGVLSFSIDYANGVDMNNISSLYVPFYNGYVNIFDSGSEKASYMVNIINSLSISGFGSYSNVKTLYGTIFLNSGNYKLLNFFVFFVFNVFLIVFRRLFNQRFKYTNTALTMYLACLLISWFEFYYWHAFLLYGVIYAVILDFFACCIARKFTISYR